MRIFQKLQKAICGSLEDAERLKSQAKSAPLQRATKPDEPPTLMRRKYAEN
jgi:hypothetical protein